MIDNRNRACFVVFLMDIFGFLTGRLAELAIPRNRKWTRKFCSNNIIYFGINNIQFVVYHRMHRTPNLRQRTITSNLTKMNFKCIQIYLQFS